MENPASSALIERLLAQASDRGERIVSAGRSIFITASLVRTFALHAFDPTQSGVLSTRFWLSTGSGLFVLVASAWFVLRSKDKLAPEWAIWGSIALDAVTIFSALLSNVLWPWPEYRGLLTIPDFAALIVIMAIAGFRFLPRAALAGGALNVIGLLLLVAIDRRISGAALQYGLPEVILVLILAVATVTLAVLSAARTRLLVQRAALESLRAETSNANLVRLLSDHHDAKNIVASSLLLSEWMAKHAVSAGVSPEIAETAHQLHRDVKRIAELVGSQEKVSQFELAKQNSVELVNIDGLLEDVFSQLGEQYPVEFEVDDMSASEPFWVVGGRPTLRRMFFNVLLNCCQGDGKRGATRVRVRPQQGDGQRIFRIEDDGPGFRQSHAPPAADAVDAAARACGPSAKRGGWGIGMDLVSTLAEASGGSFQWGNRPDTPGAYFEFRFLRG